MDIVAGDKCNARRQCKISFKVMLTNIIGRVEHAGEVSHKEHKEVLIRSSPDPLKVYTFLHVLHG